MSAQQAIHQAVYAVLRGNAGVTSILAADPDAGSPTRPSVLDHVPQATTTEDDSRFPYAVLGDVTGTEFDTDDKDGQESTITIHVWDRYRGRKRIRQALDAIYNALHNVQFTVSGHTLVYCYFEFSEVLLEEAPKVQHAVTRFRIVTQEQ